MSKKTRFSDVLDELEKHHDFKKFKKQHSKAYLAAGFFILDYDTKKVTRQLDYSTKEKLFTFYLDENYKLKEEIIKEQDLKEIKLPKELKIDIHNLKDMVEGEIELKQINKKILKIIAVLQVHDDVLKWNLTCILDQFKMLRLHIDASNGNVLFSETSSMLDFIKKA